MTIKEKVMEKLMPLERHTEKIQEKAIELTLKEVNEIIDKFEEDFNIMIRNDFDANEIVVRMAKSFEELKKCLIGDK